MIYCMPLSDVKISSHVSTGVNKASMPEMNV